MREIRKEHKNVLKRNRDQMTRGNKAEGAQAKETEKKMMEEHDDEDDEGEHEQVGKLKGDQDGVLGTSCHLEDAMRLNYKRFDYSYNTFVFCHS